MLKICCERDYFKSVVAAAKKMGGKSWDSFKRNMTHMGNFGGGVKEGVTKIYKDFAPLSFGFSTEIRGRPWINGAMIYYGPCETGVGGPQFSVTIDPQKFPHWQINT